MRERLPGFAANDTAEDESDRDTEGGTSRRRLALASGGLAGLAVLWRRRSRDASAEDSADEMETDETTRADTGRFGSRARRAVGLAAAVAIIGVLLRRR